MKNPRKKLKFGKDFHGWCYAGFDKESKIEDIELTEKCPDEVRPELWVRVKIVEIRALAQSPAGQEE
jgi:hypothetical protein